MISDDVAAADGVHADLRFRAGSDHSLTTVDHILFIGEPPRLADPLRNRHSGSAGRILLLIMMRLNDLHIVIAQDSGDFLRKIEEQIHTDAEIGSKHDSDFFLLRKASEFVRCRRTESGRADHDRTAFFRRQSCVLHNRSAR